MIKSKPIEVVKMVQAVQSGSNNVCELQRAWQKQVQDVLEQHYAQHGLLVEKASILEVQIDNSLKSKNALYKESIALYRETLDLVVEIRALKKKIREGEKK